MRFSGFQDEGGVAVLDTLTGELVYYPFDGGESRILCPARLSAAEETHRLPLAAAQQPHSTRTEQARQQARLRPERRLDQPRRMVIRYPAADEVAAIKAARLAGLRPELGLGPPPSPPTSGGSNDPED